MHCASPSRSRPALGNFYRQSRIQANLHKFLRPIYAWMNLSPSKINKPNRIIALCLLVLPISEHRRIKPNWQKKSSTKSILPSIVDCRVTSGGTGEFDVEALFSFVSD